MSRSKKKKLKQRPVESSPKNESTKGVPISNLPENFLWMRVKPGTKMRNVLKYAANEFLKREAIVWSADGKGIAKCISCAELFKRTEVGTNLHQVTKLRYVSTPKNVTQTVETNNIKKIAEIFILQSRVPMNVNEPGYQSPEDSGLFSEVSGDVCLSHPKDALLSDLQDQARNNSRAMPSQVAEEFAAMGLRTGQKRPRREQQGEAAPFKKNKKKGDIKTS